MAKLSILNTSRAMQGVHTVDGERWVKPGEILTAEFNDDQAERIGNLGRIFTVTAERTAEREPDEFDGMDDDTLRATVTALTGKEPHHKTGRAKLLSLARGEVTK